MDRITNTRHKTGPSGSKLRPSTGLGYKILLLLSTIAVVSVVVVVCIKQINHNSVGLVLSGGGAKCATEIGVIKVLEQKGVDVDYVAGTSFGAVVGALYAAGYTADEIEQFFVATDWLSCFTAGIDIGDPDNFFAGIMTLLLGREEGLNCDPTGLSNAGVVESLLASMFRAKGVETFDDLKIPFACVASDFDTMEQVVFTEGPVLLAVRASMAFPGLLKPIKTADNKVLIDGGLLNNLPVDVALSMGAKRIIAVDVQQREGMKVLPTISSVFSNTGIFKWITTRPDIEIHKCNVNLANIYLNPDTHGRRTISFQREDLIQMVRIGEETATLKREIFEDL